MKALVGAFNQEKALVSFQAVAEMLQRVDTVTWPRDWSWAQTVSGCQETAPSMYPFFTDFSEGVDQNCGINMDTLHLINYATMATQFMHGLVIVQKHPIFRFTGTRQHIFAVGVSNDI